MDTKGNRNAFWKKIYGMHHALKFITNVKQDLNFISHPRITLVVYMIMI